MTNKKRDKTEHTEPFPAEKNRDGERLFVMPCSLTFTLQNVIIVTDKLVDWRGIMPRKLARCGFSYMAGLMAASVFVSVISLRVGLAAIAAGLILLLVYRPKRGSVLFGRAVCCLCFAVGAFVYCGYDSFVCVPAKQCAGCKLSTEGRVVLAQHYSSGMSVYTVKAVLPNGKKGKLVFSSTEEHELVRGDTVELNGTLSLPDEGGFFDSRSYYRSQGVFLRLDDPEIKKVSLARNNIFAAADMFRRNTLHRIRRLTERGMDSDSGELLIGMLFGNDFWRISPSSEEALYRAGIGHIAAVSGMHMSIIAGIAAAIMTALNTPKWAKFLLTSAAAAVFAITADLTPSVMRSLAMIVIVSAAELLNRRSDTLTSAAAAGIILTVIEPFCIRSTGFILSMLGVIGKGVMAPTLIDSIQKRINEHRTYDELYKAGPVAKGAASAVCAWTAVFPAAIMSFDEISVLSPLTNLLLSPLFTAVLGISAVGMVLCAVGLYSLSSPVFALGAYVCKGILGISKAVSSLPFATIPAGNEAVPLMLIIVISGTVFVAVRIEDKSYAIITAAVGAAICSAGVGITVMLDDGYTHVSVLTEGKGSVMVIDDGEASCIIDLMDTNSGVNAASSFIKRTGASSPEAVVIIDGKGKSDSLYSEKFPEVPIIHSGGQIGLTYSDKENIIIGNCVISPSEGYTEIITEGVEIIAVTKGTPLPEKEYGLAVIGSKAAVQVNAEYYHISRTAYSGELSPSASFIFGKSGEYIIEGDRIKAKEEQSWLR